MTFHERRGGKRRRRLEAIMFAPVDVDLNAWVDSLTDDEFGDVIGPSWAELTGRRVEDLEIEWTDERADHAT